MQQFIHRITAVLLLVLVTGIAAAQNTDTIKNRIEVVMDGNKAVNKELSIVFDSVDLLHARIVPENGKLYVVYDTFPNHIIKGKILFKQDSAFAHKRDSLYKKNGQSFRKNDSLFRISRMDYQAAQKARKATDPVFKKQQVEYRSAQKAWTRSDSLFKISQRDYEKSQKNFRKSMKLDSLKRLDWKQDSLRIKEHLKILKSDLKRLKTDSSRLLNSSRKKMVVSKEFNCNDNGQLAIENIGRKLIIKNATGNSIRIETVLIYDSTAAPKNINWEQQFNIAVSGDRSKLTIKKANAENPSQKNTPPANAAYKSPVTIYVPASVKINIEHRYNELIIMDNLMSVDLDLYNAPLKMQDAEKAVIKSRYGAVRAGSIGNAELDLLNCNFTSPEIRKMKIISKYSTINVKVAEVVDMNSFSDQYNFAKAGEIKGSKSFGQFNIKLLDKSMSLDASSADLKIDAIDASAKTIKVDNKYADMKFPVQQLPNYSLQFDGTYSKVLTAFESIQTGARDSSKARTTAFSKTVGNIQKDYTEFVVKCTSCSVNFL